MEYLYIDNYMQLSNNEKQSFLSFLQKHKEFKVASLEMVCSEGALILGFLNDRDTNRAYENLTGFFERAKNIKIDFIKKLSSKNTYTVLSFSQDNRRIRV